MELAVLDVGQGDGIYLRTSDGQDIFIDGGSTSISKVGTYRILPFLKCKGVKEIDYWFVSHADKDHVSGLQEILMDGYCVKNLVFSDAVIMDETYEELMTLAEHVGTEVVHMGYLDCLHMRETKITSVFPYEGFSTEDKNAASLVLYYEDGAFDGLFTGDIGTEEEAWIAEHCSEWLQASVNNTTKEQVSGAADRNSLCERTEIDFYKVAHHGSRYSNGEEILEILKPEVAVISCGVNNQYGHPHGDTLARLENAGCEVWNTAESGQVTLEGDADIVVTIRVYPD